MCSFAFSFDISSTSFFSYVLADDLAVVIAWKLFGEGQS